jgi:hypothetical protein
MWNVYDSVMFREFVICFFFILRKKERKKLFYLKNSKIEEALFITVTIKKLFCWWVLIALKAVYTAELLTVDCLVIPLCLIHK